MKRSSMVTAEAFKKARRGSPGTTPLERPHTTVKSSSGSRSSDLTRNPEVEIRGPETGTDNHEAAAPPSPVR